MQSRSNYTGLPRYARGDEDALLGGLAEFISASHAAREVMLNLFQHLVSIPETLKQVQGDVVPIRRDPETSPG